MDIFVNINPKKKPRKSNSTIKDNENVLETKMCNYPSDVYKTRPKSARIKARPLSARINNFNFETARVISSKKNWEYKQRTYETMIKSKIKQKNDELRKNQILDLKINLPKKKSPNSKQYTEKYVGIINGEFGVLSK